MSDPRRSPLRNCVSCLYRIGLGVGKIALIVHHKKSVCFKWVRSEGILDPARARRWNVKCKGRKCPRPINPDRLIMLEYRRELAGIKKSEMIWINHPERAAYRARKYHNEIYPKIAEKQKARARAQWFVKKNDPEWRAQRLQAARNWRKQNADYQKQWNAKWRKANPEKWMECRRSSQRQQRQNPQYRMRHNLRGRIREFMKRGTHKQSATRLLGCGRQLLMQWIESKFTKGMNWNNYGVWQVDHIIPCASFDLTNPEQQRQCFHYTNLQPLWATANLLKGDKIITTQPELSISLI